MKGERSDACAAALLLCCLRSAAEQAVLLPAERSEAG
jgi:hypothetical protein